MKKISISIVLLTLVLLALMFSRLLPGNGQEPKDLSSALVESNTGTRGVNHPEGEGSKEVQVTNQPSALAQESNIPIVASGQSGISHIPEKVEAPMKTPEHNEGISADDQDLRRFVGIAFDHAKEVMEIKDSTSATVEYVDNIAIVTFPFPRKNEVGRPPYPGPDYLARVKIDRKTSKILEVLGAP